MHLPKGAWQDMDCPKCGVHNRNDAERCRMCGNPMRLIQRRPSGPTKTCPFCHTLNDKDAPFCTECKRPLGTRTAKVLEADMVKEREKRTYDRTWADAPASALRTARCSVGGILMLMVAMFIVADIAFTIAESYRETQMAGFDRVAEQYPALKSFMANIVVCQSIRLVFALLAFFGAVAAIRRINYGVGIIGGVFGIVGLLMSISALVYAVWLLVAFLVFAMAVIALILVAISRREFKLA